tara:strand:- start:35 stop:613 length:579 start_codon:yes stop_codon:yes gene_type:complete
MGIKTLLNFLNSILLYYGEKNKLNEKSLIQLAKDYDTIDKIFESLIHNYEKDAHINEDYLNKIFNEYSINIDEANLLLNQLKKPKEPTFSKKALLKSPGFSKSKFEKNLNPSFGLDKEKNLYDSSSNDESNFVINLFSFLFPIVGIIIYAIEIDKKPVKAKAAANSAILGIIIGVILCFIYISNINSIINDF